MRHGVRAGRARVTRGVRASRVALALAFAACLLAAAPAAAKKPVPRVTNTKREDRPVVTRDRELMGARLAVQAEAHDSTACGRAIERALSEVDRLDLVLGSWRGDSEVSRLNAGPGGVRLPCSFDLAEAAAAALEIARETDGAFDPTLEPLVRAWDLRGAGREPAREELRRALDRTGWPRVLVDRSLPTIRFQRDSMGLDFEGIARGFALDRAARLLREGTVRRALLDFGDEALAFSDGPAWSVRVRDPEDRDREVVNLVVREAAVATCVQSSGGVTVGHRRYGPVLDPRSGRPLESVAGVTVVTSSAARAEALSAALLVMGRADAEAFAEAHGEIGVVWLERVAGVLQGWRWNLPGANALPGSRLKWMN